MSSSSDLPPSSDFTHLMNENNRLLLELQNEVSELHQLNSVAATRRTVYGIIEPDSASATTVMRTPSSTKATVPNTQTETKNKPTYSPSKSTVHHQNHHGVTETVTSVETPLEGTPALSYQDLINANTNTLEQYIDKIKEAQSSKSFTVSGNRNRGNTTTDTKKNTGTTEVPLLSTPQPPQRWNSSGTSKQGSLAIPPVQDTLSAVINPDIPSLPPSTPVSALDAVHARLAILEAEIQSSNKMNRSYVSKAETSKSLLEAYLRNDAGTATALGSSSSLSSSTSLLTPLSFKQAFHDANNQVRAPPSRPAPKAPNATNNSSNGTMTDSLTANIVSSIVPSSTATTDNPPPPSVRTPTMNPTVPTKGLSSTVSSSTIATIDKENILHQPSSLLLPSSSSLSLPESNRSSMNDSIDGLHTPPLLTTEETKLTVVANTKASVTIATVSVPVTSSPAPLVSETVVTLNTTVVPPASSSSPNPRPRTPVSRIFVTDVDPTDQMISSVRGRSITKFKNLQDNKSKLTTLTNLSTNILGSSISSLSNDLSSTTPSHHPLQSSSSFDLKSPLSVRIAQYRNEPGQFDERMLAAKGRLIAQATLSSSTGIVTTDEVSSTVLSASRSPSRSPSRSRAPLVVTAPVPNFGHILSGAHRLQHYQLGPSTMELIAMQKAQEAIEAAEAEARRKEQADIDARRQAEAEARARERAKLREAATKQTHPLPHHEELHHKPSFFSTDTNSKDGTTESDPTLQAAAQIFAEKKNKGPFGRLGARALLKAAAHSIMEAHEATSPTSEQVKARLEESTDDKMASLVKLAAKKAVAEGNMNLRLGSLTTRTQATHRGQLAREVQQLMTRQNIQQLQQRTVTSSNPYQTKENTSASAVTERVNTYTATQDLVSPTVNTTAQNEIVSPILTTDLNEIFSSTTTLSVSTKTATINVRETNVAVPTTPTVVTPLPTPSNTETVPTSASAMTGIGTPNTDASPAPTKKKGFSGIARSMMGVFSTKKSKDTTDSPTK